MSRAACHPTDEELRSTFERLLASADHGIPSCTGLDSETLAAIERAWDTPSPTLRAAARRVFALQLNGTHARTHAREARPGGRGGRGDLGGCPPRSRSPTREA